MKEKERR